MARTISQSVGFGGANYLTDVKTIQDLLNRVPPNKGRPVPFLVIDGICGILTIAAIHQFQLINFGRADARVDPGGPTLKALNGCSGGQDATSIKQDDPFADYDFGPKRPVVPISTTYVCMANRVGGHSTPEADLSGDLLSWFVTKLTALDKALKGNARQSWGMIIWGEGTGKDSTATTLSKDGKVWGSFDYAKFMQIMDLVLAVIPKGSSYRATLKNMRDALNAHDKEKVATFVKEGAEKIEDIKAISKTQLPNKGTPATPSKQAPDMPAKVVAPKPPSKVDVGHWVALAGPDAGSGLYTKILYSDGSTSFYYGGIYGSREVPDPKCTDWKQVPIY